MLYKVVVDVDTRTSAVKLLKSVDHVKLTAKIFYQLLSYTLINAHFRNLIHPGNISS